MTRYYVEARYALRGGVTGLVRTRSAPDHAPCANTRARAHHVLRRLGVEMPTGALYWQLLKRLEGQRVESWNSVRVRLGGLSEVKGSVADGRFTVRIRYQQVLQQLSVPALSTPIQMRKMAGRMAAALTAPIHFANPDPGPGTEWSFGATQNQQPLLINCRLEFEREV